MQIQQAPVNVVGSSIFGRYPKISLEKTYNMYISDDWLISFAGYKKRVELSSNQKGRGAFRSIRNNIIVVVVGNSVFWLDTNLFPTFIGVIKSSSGDVFMDENLNNQICIVDGINMYIYNHSIGTLTLQDLTDIGLEDSLVPNYVTYHNTFFLIGNGKKSGDGAAWYAFVYESPTTITVQTQLALQTKPDYAIAIERIPGGGNNVIVFGTSVSEIWTQVGGIQNYQRNSSMNIDYGCLSVSTIASGDKYVMWLGVNENNSPSITLFSGNQAMSISTDGIDYQLGLLKYPSQSTAFFFRDDGHLFYQITFYNPEDNLSLIYDMDTKKFFHVSDRNLNYHPANHAVYFNNNIYFSSLNNGCLYQAGTSFTTYDEEIEGDETDTGYEIPRIRICSNIRKPDSSRFIAKNLAVTIDQGNDKRFSLLSIQDIIEFIVTEEEDFIITEGGARLITQDSHYALESIKYIPRVDLTISKDGGETFSNTVGMHLRPIGNRKNILRWQRQFGQANDLVFKFRFWGKSYFCVWNGVVDIVS